VVRLREKLAASAFINRLGRQFRRLESVAGRGRKWMLGARSRRADDALVS
jgi:hypothetical protein